VTPTSLVFSIIREGASLVEVMVASAIIAPVKSMKSMVRAQRRNLIISRRRLLLVIITTVLTPHSIMTAPTEQGQTDSWHPRYRVDKQLICFISKDNEKFAFDREILRKER